MTLSFSITACQSEQPNKTLSINGTLEQFKLAVNTKNYDAISNYLSDEYEYEGISDFNSSLKTT